MPLTPEQIVIPKEFVDFLKENGNMYTVALSSTSKETYVNFPQLVKLMPDGTGLISKHKIPISTAQSMLTDAIRIILNA